MTSFAATSGENGYDRVHVNHVYTEENGGVEGGSFVWPNRATHSVSCTKLGEPMVFRV